MKKKKSWKLAKNITGISTGYKVIDQLFNGLQPGELMLIGGTPLSGKSTLALNIAINVMKETRKKVVIFDASLGYGYAEKWFLAYLSDIPIWEIDRWDFSIEQWERFIHATEEYRKFNFDAYGAVGLEYIIEECEELSEKGELGLIIIDYLQIIKKNNKSTFDNPNDVLIEFNSLARRLHVPVIVLTSLRERAMYRRKDKLPCADDLKNRGISEEYWENALLLKGEEDCIYTGLECIEIVATKSYSDIEFKSDLYLNHDNLKIEDTSYELNDESGIIIDDYEDLEEENRKNEEKILAEMRECLENRWEEVAIRCANRLREIDYYSYGEEVENCYKICAQRGNVTALLYMEDKYRRKGEVCEEEFDVLKQLINLGYTKVFGRIADCYLNGIGCEKDREKALLNYINGSVYWEDEYCENMIEENFKNEKEWYILSPKITDLYLYDWKESEKARIRLANDIFEGKIKEFKSEVAYYIYKNKYYYDVFYQETKAQYCSIPCVNLAKCLLYGIGTSVKPNVALAVLNDAQYLCEWERKSGDITAFDRIEEIETMKKEIEEVYGRFEPEYTEEEFDLYNDEDAFLGEMNYLEEEDYDEDEAY